MTAVVLYIFAAMPTRGDWKPDVVERLRVSLREVEQGIMSWI
jgi:hypothetical protein